MATNYRTWRVYYRSITSGWFNFNFGTEVRGDAVFHISATQGVLVESPDPLVRAGTHKGSAPIYIKNVSPHWYSDATSGVNYWIQVDWNEPLDIRVDITVFDPPTANDVVIL
ncbi:hypothetical protein QYM13_23840 [Bacillus pacificus]|uniref:hypothetical protein n=1 Tax=Bacillus pacificus TaxID=2026187 RepID=UPI0027FEE646|nr:hypothetical protein [Bacillus pacificus]MDQ7236784.1 hypothetical protein [Bacillus pacificus]MDQ7237765.1 hypothetical protein [Bacillus pacificus]